MSSISYLLFHKDHPLPVKGPCGGAEMATRSLAFALARGGHRVVVCGILPQGETTYNGVEFWNLTENFNVEAALVRARGLGTYHLTSAGRAYPLLASRSEKNCISRTFICHDPNPGAIGVTSSVLNQVVDGVVAVSQAQATMLQQSGINGAKISIIYNGYDKELFTATPPEARNLNQLLFVGAIVPHKGAHVLIEAYAKLKATFPQLTLDIIGSASLWGEKSYLDESALAAQLPGLTFLGAKESDEIASYMQRAGLCICPSIWFEALGITAIEAQATGCPVIVTDAGGLPETVINGETGLVVSANSADALVRAIESLISDKQKLLQLSRNAAKRTAERFGWDTAAKLLISQCNNYTPTSHKELPDPQNTPAHVHARSSTVRTGKVALLSTWNQECGLGTYGKFLFSEFPKDSFIVLAEKVSAQEITSADESYVRRVWRKDSLNSTEILSHIQEHGVQLLHLNLHDHLFLPLDQLISLVKEVKKRECAVVAHFHTTFTFDPRAKPLLDLLDGIIVHTPENRLQLTSYDISADKIWVLPHGIKVGKPLSAESRLAVRSELGVLPGEKCIVSFGFVQPNKGMESVIEAVASLSEARIAARGFILGKVNEKHPSAREYRVALEEHAKKLGVSDRITFADRFLPTEQVERFLAAADLILMNYHSQYYEASGAGSIAVGSGTLVATSLAPQFAPFGDSVWHLTSGFPAGLSAQLLLQDSSPAAAQIRTNSARHIARYAWPRCAQKLQILYKQKLSFVVETVAAAEPMERIVENNTQTLGVAKKQGKRVLFQNRASTFSQRGGDTVVMERLTEGLTARGWNITIDIDGKEDPKQYDLVHLFNFALPELTRTFAERALQAGTPYVVTTLYEDVPTFHNQSRVLAATLIDYQSKGQSKVWWEQNKERFKSVPQSPRFENDWTAQHAHALISNGTRESATLQRDYPQAKRIIDIPLGCELGVQNASEELFIKEYGVKDFILCVGRLESRKNQLMLLKALEESELTVVLAAGGFSYQPEYETAVRNFKRRGKTVILGKVSPEMLASAYRAAKVHVLTSWYELPGLVSLEAARYGSNVVVTDCGTTKDYLGDKALYCEPTNEASILNAVLAAYYGPKVVGLRERAESFTWNVTTEKTAALYQEIVATAGVKAAVTQVAVQATSIAAPQYDLAASGGNLAELVAQSEEQFRAKNFAKAHEILDNAEKYYPASGRIARTRGALYLAVGETVKARENFSKACVLDPKDLKSLDGLGICAMNEKNFTEAFAIFTQVLSQNPADGVAVMQMVQCAYSTSRYDELEKALRGYLAQKSSDIDIMFCLAGCLFKLGKLCDATSWLQKIVAIKPDYTGISDLKAQIAEAENVARAKAASTVVVPTKHEPEATTPRLRARQTQKEESTTKQPTDIDMLLSAIEDDKRWKRMDKVKAGIASLPPLSTMTADQREWVQLINAELAVFDGDITAAQALYDEVQRSNPRSARAMCGQGALAGHRGDWQKARELFEQSLTFCPEYDIALAGLGLCCTQVGDREGAWDCYRRALKQNSENVRALLGVIELGYSMKRFTAVEEAIRGYLDMHPADLEFIYSLAGCFFAQGKLRETIEAVEKITLFKPDHEKALELRDMVRAKMSNVSVGSGVGAV